MITRICPNTSTREWKLMVKHTDEHEAYRAFIAHGFTLPNAIPLTELKKTELPQYSTQSQN